MKLNVDSVEAAQQQRARHVVDVHHVPHVLAAADDVVEAAPTADRQATSADRQLPKRKAGEIRGPGITPVVRSVSDMMFRWFRGRFSRAFSIRRLLTGD